jgi:tetratricopeptide (TPR) repeat protein
MADQQPVPDDARAALRAVMQSHAGGDIDVAIAAVEAVVAQWPDYAQARSYLGQTLVTRKRRFADGIEELDRAVAICHDDPYILYSAGWCREFIANALAKPKGGAHQPVALTSDQLYASANALFLRALHADPDDQLQGDIEDMLTVISKVTGVPWDDGEEVERATPRAR